MKFKFITINICIYKNAQQNRATKLKVNVDE